MEMVSRSKLRKEIERMDIRKGNYYTENRKKTFNWIDRLAQLVGGLNRFLKHLQENKPEIYDDYLEALKNKLSSLIKPKVDLETIRFPKFQEIIEKCNTLQKLNITYALQLLGVSESYSSETIELPWYIYDKSSLYPFYYRGLTLCEQLGKTEAIEYLRNYIDEIMNERFEPIAEYDDLSRSFWEVEYPFDDYDPTDDIRFRLHQGKMGARVDRCIKHDIMKPLNDPELSYVICCYPEIAHSQVVRPNVAYTRTTSLIKGGPYCDNCLHDKRHVTEITHPSKEFWESLDSKLD